MGLDCSHDAFSGAYSSFDRFRGAVAKAAGGTWGNTWSIPFSKAEKPGLCEFLGHSDCDGEISPEMCKHLADEMEELLPKIDKSVGHGHISAAGGYEAVLRRFIAGCRLAHSLNEPLGFS